MSIAPDLLPDDPLSPIPAVYMGTFPEIPASTILTSVDLADPTGQFRYLFSAFELSSHDASLMDPSALPVDPPPLAALDPFGFDPSSAFGYGTDLALAGGDGLRGIGFFARIELGSLVRVPEPSAFALIALALLAVRYPRSR